MSINIVVVGVIHGFRDPDGIELFCSRYFKILGNSIFNFCVYYGEDSERVTCLDESCLFHICTPPKIE